MLGDCLCEVVEDVLDGTILASISGENDGLHGAILKNDGPHDIISDVVAKLPLGHVTEGHGLGITGEGGLSEDLIHKDPVGDLIGTEKGIAQLLNSGDDGALGSLLDSEKSPVGALLAVAGGHGSGHGDGLGDVLGTLHKLGGVGEVLGGTTDGNPLEIVADLVDLKHGDPLDGVGELLDGVTDGVVDCLCEVLGEVADGQPLEGVGELIEGVVKLDVLDDVVKENPLTGILGGLLGGHHGGGDDDNGGGGGDV